MNEVQFGLKLKHRSGHLQSFAKPCVMGVINVSPDSFFNPMSSLDQICYETEEMIKAGAMMIDIGGEATNPMVTMNREGPSYQQEIDRVIPVIEILRQKFDVWLSVDTSNNETMKASVTAGADMINDQRMLKRDGAIKTIAELNTVVCLMHHYDLQRSPNSCSLKECLLQIKQSLSEKIVECEKAGIHHQRIIIDPGFGTGNYRKSTRENFYLLKNLAEFNELGYPVLIGWSRKSMIGEVLGNVSPQMRLFGSIAAATIAALHGAAIIRTHDVQATMDAVKVVNAFLLDERTTAAY